MTKVLFIYFPLPIQSNIGTIFIRVLHKWCGKTHHPQIIRLSYPYAVRPAQKNIAKRYISLPAENIKFSNVLFIIILRKRLT